MQSEINFSFPACRRIRQRSEFDRAFRTKGLVNKWFVIYAIENTCGFSRLGLAVSKKNIPAATARNFTKRLIRELFRKNFPVRRALDVVVSARKQINPGNAVEGRLGLVQLLKAIQA